MMDSPDNLVNYLDNQINGLDTQTYINCRQSGKLSTRQTDHLDICGSGTNRKADNLDHDAHFKSLRNKRIRGFHIN